MTEARCHVWWTIVLCSVESTFWRCRIADTCNDSPRKHDNYYYYYCNAYRVLWFVSTRWPLPSSLLSYSVCHFVLKIPQHDLERVAHVTSQTVISILIYTFHADFTMTFLLLATTKEVGPTYFDVWFISYQSCFCSSLLKNIKSGLSKLSKLPLKIVLRGVTVPTR